MAANDRVTQSPVLVARSSGLGEERVSQAAVLVATRATPQARITQTPVLVAFRRFTAGRRYIVSVSGG